MTIEELEILKKDNAVKAKQILEAEDGIVEDAQKLLDENEKLQNKIEALKSLDEQLLPVKSTENKEIKMENKEIELPNSVKFASKSLPFEGGSRYEKAKKAYAFGKLVQAIRGDKKATSWLSENYGVKAMNETTNSAGGFLVPDELMAELIFLRDQYGVVRRNADVRTMGSDTLWIPKNSASATTYWVGDNAGITASDITLARVEVLAKKVGILTQISSELNEDAVVEIGAAWAQDVAWKIESEIDRVCMLGSSANATDGNINGFITENLGVASNTGTIAAASGTVANWTAVSRQNLRSMVGVLPLYADRPGEVKWFMSRRFYQDVVCNILDGLGGNGVNDLANFNNGNPTLFGYPIEFSQHLASTAAGTVNTHLCAFGNLKTGTVYGDRRDLDIRMSEHYYFNADSLAMKATSRVGFTCHDPGTNGAAGSVVVLKRTT